MIYFILSILFFLLTICAHIFLHRILVKRNIVSYRSIYIFGFGFLFTILFLFYISVSVSPNSFWSLQYPLSSSFVYALLAFLYYIYFGNAYLGEDSPSSRIFYHLQTGPKSYEQILSYFSDDSLVGKRVVNLLDAGLVSQSRDSRYTVTSKGIFLMTIIEVYRNLLHWNKGG